MWEITKRRNDQTRLTTVQASTTDESQGESQRETLIWRNALLDFVKLINLLEFLHPSTEPVVSQPDIGHLDLVIGNHS